MLLQVMLLYSLLFRTGVHMFGPCIFFFPSVGVKS